jgi:hypothetical protein
MNDEQQNQIIALLLAIAMDGSTKTKTDLQKAAKRFLGTLPSEMISKAASTQVEF